MIESVCEEILPTLGTLAAVMRARNLDGQQGTNRESAESCQINAKNDWQAIQAWLAEYELSPSTVRLYRLEAERFLLWCVLHRIKPLSSINREDIGEYETFLQNPTPDSRWCGPRATRGSHAWRPFVSGLSATARQTTVRVLQSLFTYLTQARYLRFNPFSLIKQRRQPIKNTASQFMQEKARVLAGDEWEALLAALYAMPDDSLTEKFYKSRLKFLIAMLYFLGLRVSELISQSWTAFQQDQEGCWWYYVIGKGKKPRLIPVANLLLREIINYRHSLKLMPLPNQEETFLLTKIAKNTPLSARQVNYLIKKLAHNAAQQFAGDTRKANRLKGFSPHWIRHLSASMQSEFGIESMHIKDNHGHTNESTTMGYIHRQYATRHQAMQKLKWKMDKK